MIDWLKYAVRLPAAREATALLGIVLVALASPRLAVLLFILWTIALAVRRDGDTGTWSTLYVVLLIILAVLAFLIAGLALLHRLLSG